MIEQWADQVEMDENQVPPLTSVSNKALLLAFMLHLDVYLAELLFLFISDLYSKTTSQKSLVQAPLLGTFFLFQLV